MSFVFCTSALHLYKSGSIMSFPTKCCRSDVRLESHFSSGSTQLRITNAHKLSHVWKTPANAVTCVDSMLSTVTSSHLRYVVKDLAVALEGQGVLNVRQDMLLPVVHRTQTRTQLPPPPPSLLASAVPHDRSRLPPTVLTADIRMISDHTMNNARAWRLILWPILCRCTEP